MKDGRLRADKEGKSYKINHMDVLNIYNSKNRVDKDREVLLSTQIVREEALDLLSIKAGRLVIRIKDLINKIDEIYKATSKKMDEIQKSETDVFKSSQVHLDLIQNERENEIKSLINVRGEIEAFYKMYDFIEDLNQIYKYKETQRNTLEEELELTKAINSGDIKYIFQKVTLEDKLFNKEKSR
ncbi:Uncharacterised protein [[Clostridium] sordellii]|nr:Uncharacterised protein [[Clostridium] sordellii] [Paeniclostridium sordellii]